MLVARPLMTICIARIQPQLPAPHLVLGLGRHAIHSVNLLGSGVVPGVDTPCFAVPLAPTANPEVDASHTKEVNSDVNKLGTFPETR
jgi:hypothetical protein